MVAVNQPTHTHTHTHRVPLRNNGSLDQFASDSKIGHARSLRIDGVTSGRERADRDVTAVGSCASRSTGSTEF
jgi:hypothetical protein